MTTVYNVRFKMRGFVAATWASDDPTLEDREFGLETDTGRIKAGDGATAWSALPYIATYAVWGRISGTLSDQTDLQAALAGKQAANARLTALAGVTPADDGTYANPTSITIENGLITAIS
tara:strand:+ start:136 stop:495 length:360 start_codon:yes stop_codon:yes gene_type:complete